MKNQKFIESLILQSILTAEDSKKLLQKYSDDAFSVLMHLVSGSAAKKSELGRLWGDSLGASYVDLQKTLFQHSIVQRLPEKLARKHKMIPLYQMGETITMAASNPADASAIAEAEKAAGSRISPLFSFPDEIEDAIEIEYRSSSSLSEFINKIASSSLFKGTTKITEKQLKDLAGDEAVVEFTRGLMLLAVKERASDIHIEPMEDIIRIRFRIDGVLHERMKLDKPLLPAVLSRLKILANADITERRRPQDGRITLPLSYRAIDFRFSSVPTIYGEKIVLRVLGQIQALDVPELEELNLSKSIFEKFKRVIESPNGVMFVTGPTGSGKTTTLYAAIKYLNKPHINIITIEDPVEYRLSGINQIQVNPDIDFDFASALRAVLRQDPNLILIGEIRDKETAKIASQAALTGHLVFATMHTNNSLQAVTRLIEIGVEPFLVAPSIIGVLSQRLVRRICDNCKEKYAPSDGEIERLFIREGKREVLFYRGKGCEQCSGTGYYGRLAIHEFFIISEDIRSLVSRNASPLEIRDVAINGGFKTLRYDGIKKVLRGLTTIEEVDRVTLSEDEW